MQDGVYIEYLMEQRIMRRTNIMDELHKIYAGKYERWIRQYLISKQILEAPLFIFCNTLYKLPDTFRIRNNSFFIGDYCINTCMIGIMKNTRIFWWNYV